MHHQDEMPDSLCQKLEGVTIYYALENGLIDNIGNKKGHFTIVRKSHPNTTFGKVGDYLVRFSDVLRNEFLNTENTTIDFGEMVFYRFYADGMYHCGLDIPKNHNLDKAIIDSSLTGTQVGSIHDPIETILFKPLENSPRNPMRGALYFDSNTNRLRCFDGHIWRNCW